MLPAPPEVRPPGILAVFVAAVVFTVAGCGGRTRAPVAPPVAVPGIAATRWVPEKPTYLFASPALRDAQHGLAGLLDFVGPVTGDLPQSMLRAAFAQLGLGAGELGPLPEIGIDLEGSWALYSEDLSPTLVVHLAAPARMTAFLDRQRGRGVAIRSQLAEGTEVFSAPLFGGLTLRWAIASDWLWIHVSPAGDDGTGWFTARRRPREATWAGDWAWAQRVAGAAPGVVGFLDARGRDGAIARAVARIPAAAACTQPLASIHRVAVGLVSDGPRVEARLALDVGSTDALAPIRRAILPPPSGWDATAARAAIAAQWNLDLGVARGWLAPCLAAAGADLSVLDEVGVRAARGLLLDFDPDAMSGAGAIALDLSRATYFARQLDRIPLRRTIERARTFGPHRGYSISIPFSVTVDYVLEPQRAIAALGEGVLARVVTATPGASRADPPVFALDVSPPAMSAAAWQTVLHSLAVRELSGAAGPATRRTVEQLMRWQHGQLAVTLTPSELVLTLSGHRR